MSQTKNRFITPLYHVLLVDATKEVQHILLTGDAQAGWEAVKTLILLVRDKDEREKLEAFVKSAEQNMELEKAERSYTIADHLEKQTTKQNYLRLQTRELYDKALTALEPYLEKKPRDIPTNISLKLFEQ